MARVRVPSLVNTSGIQGLLAPIVTLGFMLFAVASYPELSGANNALRDLGDLHSSTAV